MGMREVSKSEFVRAYAAGDAVIDVGDVGECNRGHIPGAVFSSGSMLFGFTGRPELLGPGRSCRTRGWASPGSRQAVPRRVAAPTRAGGARDRGCGQWVHCAAGHRAPIAASILLARGHRVIAVDDDYTKAAAAGLPITSADLDGSGQ